MRDIGVDLHKTNFVVCFLTEDDTSHITLEPERGLPPHPNKGGQQTPTKRTATSFPDKRLHGNCHYWSSLLSHVVFPVTPCFLLGIPLTRGNIGPLSFRRSFDT